MSRVRRNVLLQKKGALPQLIKEFKLQQWPCEIMFGCGYAFREQLMQGTQPASLPARQWSTSPRSPEAEVAECPKFPIAANPGQE